ncbi:hypothetical protein [Robiginitalea biformata]|uniref:Uncharacterized protein n=1 Tax=Robiginitalea biformata (strain ATCC BAA-864 / DSM 15991 / KCTC 12146 / HTCC2501) TaxID=313596 RepID=A4CP43_ROBBH|nr:hypothetical protein [Robiginitalea biformata]EAR14660.1 hypothetical protein RB2501_01251 [Robiginitalea biformata HTCC2501]
MRWLLLILLLASCGSRKVETNKERIKVFETSTITRKAPGDKVFIEIPRKPNKRIEVYKGERGAEVKVVYDTIGQVVTVEAECPEVSEVEELNRRIESLKKNKQTDRQAFPWGWIVAAGVAGVAIGAYLGWTTAMRRYLK